MIKLKIFNKTHEITSVIFVSFFAFIIQKWFFTFFIFIIESLKAGTARGHEKLLHRFQKRPQKPPQPI